jgi:hypothetical protein
LLPFVASIITCVGAATPLKQHPDVSAVSIAIDPSGLSAGFNRPVRDDLVLRPHVDHGLPPWRCLRNVHEHTVERRSSGPAGFRGARQFCMRATTSARRRV